MEQDLEEIRAEYIMSLAELRRGCFQWVKQSRHRLSRGKVITAVALIGIGLINLTYVFTPSASSIGPTVFVAPFVIAALVLSWPYLVVQLILLCALRLPTLGKLVTLGIRRREIKVSCSGNEVDYKPDVLPNLNTSAEGILVLLTETDFIWIPRTAFGSGQEYERALTLLQS